MVAQSEFEFVVKLILEAGIVGSIAIIVIRFLLTRLVKQLDDAESARREDHYQTLLWHAALSKTILVFERTFLLHDMTVHGINPSTGETQEERNSNAEKKLDQILESLDSTLHAIDAALDTVESDRQKTLVRGSSPQS